MSGLLVSQLLFELGSSKYKGGTLTNKQECSVPLILPKDLLQEVKSNNFMLKIYVL
jgi:hypothetical protein